LVRAYLKQCTDNELLDIANQLALDVPHDEQIPSLGESNYWLIDYFRLFISHVHTSKKSAVNLKNALKQYAISCFVAHEDIIPTHEWHEEILRALNSMDALAAILTNDFNDSKWTDQEVGFAVAKNVFQSICKNPKTKSKMVDVLVRTISSSSDPDEASFRVGKLEEIDDESMDSDWEKLRENIVANQTLRESKAFTEQINAILIRKDIAAITVEQKSPFDLDPDDEIPF
jgi:hypothetical protein